MRKLLRAALVVAGCLAVLWFLLSPLVEAARGTQCKNNLKQIGLALHGYHDLHGSFPPAVTYGPDGRAWHSWRVLVLPHLGHDDPPAGYRFDEPWDSEANLAFAERHGAGPFRCPLDSGSAEDATSYLAVVGERTVWPPDGAAGTYRNVPDGLFETLMAVESYGSGVTWTEPRDLRFDEMTFRVNAEKGTAVRGRRSGGLAWLLREGPSRAAGLYVDGSIRSVPADVPPDVLKSLLLRDDGGPKEWP